MITIQNRQGVMLMVDNTSWICTVLLGTLAVILCLNTVSSKSCGFGDIIQMQRSCGNENEKFTESESTRNKTIICPTLHKLWYCVARNVPGCLLNITEENKHYIHSPFDCRLGPEQIKEIQNLTREHERKEVSVVALTTPTTARDEKTDSPETTVTNSTVETKYHSKHEGTNSGRQTCISISLLWMLIVLASRITAFPAILSVLS